jgi:Arc/MetJ-type ribon-helix-helix transcriptional regulator
MQVTLTPEMQEFIARQVRAGHFASPDEAVNFFLAAAKAQETLGPGREDVEELRALLDPAIAELDRGEFVEFSAEDVIAERRAALAARRKTGA